MTFTNDVYSNIIANDNEAMMASKRCSSIKLSSLTFVSKSISKILLNKVLI